jgi:predicted nucleic acid-binding Zn ribbon protein
MGTVSLLETLQIVCPYCGERVEVVIDCSFSPQEYVEDCHVCCKPVILAVSVSREGEPSIQARREDE